MKLEAFFEKFDQFADAPDAVKKMRELILESAIRGKLVPQNAGDEPASALLKRMASVPSGQVRRQAAPPPVGDDAYLQISPGWAWTRLGNTGRIFNGDSVSESGKAELANVEDGLPFIATKDVGYGRDALVYDNGLKVQLGDPRLKVARAKAVLICAEGGSAGRKIGIADRDICFGNKLYANEVQEGIHHRYIFYVYQAPTFFKEFAARMTGIIGGIARSEFLSLPIPIPPEEEQKRIVAKVDELMALCDRLETQQQERAEQASKLARASLARFADAPTPVNLNFIFHPSYPIPPADLRKAILTLAVQGKLVPQDPNDEPIESVLAAMRNHKNLLIDSGGIRKPELQSPVAEDEAPFELPTGWRWQKWGNICDWITYGFTRPMAHVSSGPPIVTAKNVRDGFISLDETHYADAEEFAALRPKDRPRKGDLLIVKDGATIGRAAIVDFDEPFCISQTVAVLWRESCQLHGPFLLLIIRSPFTQSLIWSAAEGAAMPHLSITDFARMALPVPPLAEQRRIVARVEQLMALVDALETQLAASCATAANLLSAFVAELTKAA